MSDVARKYAVVIPALNPPHDSDDSGLPQLIRQMRALGFESFVIVDDGSGEEHRALFDSIAAMQGCTVMRHAVNCGKGRALKNAFNYVYLQRPDLAGVVTVDADGQHHPEDALAVAELMDRSPGRCVLGTRAFSGKVPLRSMVGNTFTRWMFAALTGKRVSDTQSGLRGIPRAALPRMIGLEGERYEYEMNMLVRERKMLEQPIRTIYLNQNRASHFNPVVDSMRVAFVLVRFYFSSLLTAAVDTVIFAICLPLTGSVLASLTIARGIVGALVNFGLNRSFVFHDASGGNQAWLAPLVKYYLLLGFNILVAYASINALHEYFGWQILVCKILVETPLSLFNFAIQRTFVFKPATNE